MKTRIGFVGLGLIGNPMSKNLVKAGHEVTVWNRTASRMDDLVAAGGVAAESAKEAAMRSEVTITMVSDSPDVEEVILGKDGVIEGAKPDSVVIDMSTISPSVTRRIASELGQKRAHMLDAPVSGGVTGAAAGTLSIMVGRRQGHLRQVPTYPRGDGRANHPLRGKRHGSGDEAGQSDHRAR